MSLNEGFWSIYHSPWSDGYSIGDVVVADLIRDIEIGKEMRCRDPRAFDRAPWSKKRQHVERRAARRVHERHLIEMGCVDLGGEAG